ncbi:MAG: hypothetical protein P1U58_03670 [Verrucomicrobiales bacterium]|nr:hypothetical protein [Verrucomicrobiales bacterium]
MHLLRCCLIALTLSSFGGCVSVDTPAGPGTAPANSGITLSEADKDAIGRKIWKNECAGTIEGLTTWNVGEDFPSLGIGHFIWYVEGRPGPFKESFPQLLKYMQASGVAVPRWVAEAKGSPWKSRSEFESQKNSPQMKEMRSFLAGTVPAQTGFIVQRLEQALPLMQRATPDGGDKQRLKENFYKVAETRTGVYALIDYVNFKGEGVKAEEKYEGVGWGLRDVLLEMGRSSGGQESANEYSEAAKRVLQRRIQNSPPSRGESRWNAGWMNRCESYKHGI